MIIAYNLNNRIGLSTLQPASRQNVIIAILVIASIAVSGLLGYYVSTIAGSGSGKIQSSADTVTVPSSSSASGFRTSATASYGDSYYWSASMMMNDKANYTWMSYPTQTIGINQAVLLMRNPPSYVVTIKSNNTVQFRSSNITILAFGMMPEDAANLTGMVPPVYATDDVFVIYGLIDPTLVIPEGASVHVIFVNLDNDMYHNLVFTTTSPPYSYMSEQSMMGGGMMGEGPNGNYYLYMMPFINPANYSQGMASAYSYSLNLVNETTLWYLCTYPGHAESGMYGKVLTGSQLTTPSSSTNESSTTNSAEGIATDYFTIYVSHLGFNDSSGKLTLSVTQGDSVSIKFIWNDSTLAFDNAHQMEVQGYAVISAVIDQKSSTSVVQFTASASGTFQINCIIPCDGMSNLQNGWLVVAPA